MSLLLFFHFFDKIFCSFSLIVLRLSVIGMRNIECLAAKLIVIQLLAKRFQISLHKLASDKAQELTFFFSH
jgi:hypothetical protein